MSHPVFSYSFSDSTGQTMDEELKLFIRKASKLQEMQEALQKHQIANSLQALREKTETIAACVQRDGTLNAGGKFEWVDSVLIKVVQKLTGMFTSI